MSIMVISGWRGSLVALLLDADAEGHHDEQVGEPDGEEQPDEGHQHPLVGVDPRRLRTHISLV